MNDIPQSNRYDALIQAVEHQGVAATFDVVFNLLDQQAQELKELKELKEKVVPQEYVNYKDYYDGMQALPSCNDCKKKNVCPVVPPLGEVARIRCPFHNREMRL
jgi:hypothetical protein